MPRGRKEPPQESVDSILLAISRRDDIDTDTMSHYMARLDETWAESAREKVLHLLRSSDPAAQAAALSILVELATDFDLEGLEDFIADPTISDLPKLSLAPILKELGSEMADDGIIEYLNDPAGAIRQMQMRLLELVGQNEMGVETILEDVVAMPLERRFAFINWLGSSSDPRAVSLLIPLMENQTGKVVTAVIEALEQLGPIALNQTIPALNRTIASTSNRELKQQARTVLGRLTMQSMLGTEDAILLESRQSSLPPNEARVSAIDGTGSQLIMLSWKRPDGRIKGINVLSLDQKGIKDCYGVDEMDPQQWHRLVDDLNEQGFSSFTVPFAYAQALVLEARAANRRTHFKLPIAYSIWRPLIEAAGPLKQLTTQYPTILPTLQLDPESIELAQQHAADLYENKEFVSWLYEPMERIEPYISRYWSALELSENTPNKRGTRKTKARAAEQQSFLDQLVHEAFNDLIDDKWCRLYTTRLNRQAALFIQADRHNEVTLIRAIAALLQTTTPIPTHEQTFPQKLLSLSIEQGPLRLMVESLRAGNLDILSSEFFHPS